MKLVVEHAEVEPQQRHAPRAGDRLGGQALAGALHAQQQHALGRIDAELARIAGERDAPPVEPAFETARPPTSVMLPLSISNSSRPPSPSASRLNFRMRRTSSKLICSSMRMACADQAARVLLAHAGEVLHDELNRLLVALQRAMALRALPQLRFFLEYFADFGNVGQRQIEARAHPREIGRQVELGADKYQRARGLVVFLRDFLDQPHIHGVFEVRLRIDQHVDAVLRRFVDMPQRVLEFVGLGDDIRARHAFQAVGDGPHEQRPAFEVGGALEQSHHARLLARFDLHHRKARADDDGQVAKGISHGGSPSWCEQLVVYAAETAVAHDEDMVAGLRGLRNRRHELCHILMDFRFGAERRERGGGSHPNPAL